MKEKYGPDFYKKIGAKGGIAPHEERAFAADRELASRAGRLGGKASKPFSKQRRHAAELAAQHEDL
jgi:general stress protein YciG